MDLSARHAFIRCTGIALAAIFIACMPVTQSAGAEASPAVTLRKLTPSALRGNRVAIREVAKALVKVGPRQVGSATRLRPLMRREALRGSSAAANAYGMMLQYGIGGPVNTKEAPSWYARGSGRGNNSAAKNAALAYALGWGVRRDTGRAIRLLATVPPDQRARQMFEISEAMLQPGREEPEMALYWMQRIVAMGDVASGRAADLYERIASLDPAAGQEIMQWLEPLASAGDPDAAVALARRLLQTGNQDDRSRASRLFLMAAEKDDPRAMEELGTMLAGEDAAGIEQSSLVAFLDERAQAGSNAARMALGNFYAFQSAGHEELRQRGLRYMELAAKEGDAEAQYRLAMMLLGSTDQLSRAHAYLVLSAESGNERAEIAIAQLGEMSTQEARRIVGVTAQN